MEQFIKDFAEQFEDTDIVLFSSETIFKDIDEWSSLLALSIIAMADEKYGVLIKGDDIRNAKTINDLYKIIIEKR